MSYGFVLIFYGILLTLGPKLDYYSNKTWLLKISLIIFSTVAEFLEFLLFWNVAFTYW